MTDLFDGSHEDVAESERAAASRRDAAQREAKRRAAKRRNVITFFVMIVAIALLVGGAVVLIRPMLEGRPATQEITDYPGPGTGEVQIVINNGETGADIATTLDEADVIASRGAFINAYNNNVDAVSIQAGTYTLQLQMRASDAVAALLDPASRSDLTVTIPEGWRASTIYERVANRLGVTVEEVEAAAAEIAATELPPEAGGNIEGWLFASTYTIQPESTPAGVLQQMVDLTIATLDERGVAPEDRQSVLIQASIVEAEVANPDELGMVARVLTNRLANCSGDLRIGMDTTYAYGLGKPAYEITKSEWETEHPYNTRLASGLPPTPIGSPGVGAVDAVLNPTPGDWCYFVTVNPETGETRFTADLAEHHRNQELYREWLAQQSEG